MSLYRKIFKILLIIFFVNNYLYSGIIINEAKDKSPTSFRSIIFEDIFIYDYNPEIEYFLWIQEEGNQPTKLKNSNKYIKPRSDSSVSGIYPSVNDKDLISELRNLRPNTKYTFFIASENKEYIYESEVAYTHSVPVKFDIVKSGFNFIEIQFKQKLSTEEIVIKIKDKSTNKFLYLDDEFNLIEDVSVINTNNLKDNIKVKDEIKPNTDYLVSVSSINISIFGF